jgi:NADP-dependent 3-hydroxy acid dehydrogenase YdfG
MRLAGRTTVVTGASRGIGEATARALVVEGARVLAVARSPVAIDGVDAIIADLTDDASVARVVAWAGAVDVVINAAGVFALEAIEETEPAVFDTMLAVNAGVPFRLIRGFLPGMRRRRTGHIVTVGSIADHVAFPENGAYAASKFAVRGLHAVLREELRGSGIRATLVSPAAVDTSLWDDIDPGRHPGVPPRSAMLPASAVADAIVYAVTAPAGVGVDEIRLSACIST